MLVIHPSSCCDVCLDPYTEDRIPQVINCGHTFCLRCLQMLPRRICPLCRRDFEPAFVRRLHTAKEDITKNRSRSPSPEPSSEDESDEGSPYSRELQRRITRIIREGALSVEVTNALEDVNEWLQDQPPEEHADLRAAHILLFRYTELQRKYAERKATMASMQQTYDELQEQLCASKQEFEQQLRAQEETAHARYEELERLRTEEREDSRAVEADLRDQLAKIERNWIGRYEVCVNECRRLTDALKDCERNHQKSLPGPSRYDLGGRICYLERTSPQQKDLVILNETPSEPANSLRIDMGENDNMFHVSPVPPTLPIPPLPSETFRSLSDDVPDSEDEGMRDRNARAIPIRSGAYRTPNSSLLLKYDEPMARSLPRSLVDVHMAGCSPSSSVSSLNVTIRERRTGSRSPVGNSQEGSLGLPLSGRYINCLDMSEEEQQVRRRARLHEVLHDPNVKTPSSSSSGSTSSSMSSTAPAIPPPPSQPHRSNTVRWASEAAKAAERARAATVHGHPTQPTTPISPSTVSRVAATRTPSPTATRAPSPTRSPVQSQWQVRPQQMRTASSDSLKANMKIPAMASGLTRSFLTQEGAYPQRVS